MLGRNIIFFSGELIVKKLSRSREFYADAIGASLAKPRMIGALEKLERIQPDRRQPNINTDI